MKSISLLTILLFPWLNIDSQSKSFVEFLAKFEKFDFPVKPIEFLVYREANLNTIRIDQEDFYKYLRTPNDTFWKFDPKYEYFYGGKNEFPNAWLLFYSRNYFPDNINEQKSEIVLGTFSKNGKLISEYVVSGSYGDSISITAVLNTPNDILLEYENFGKNGSNIFKRNLFIDSNNVIQVKQ